MPAAERTRSCAKTVHSYCKLRVSRRSRNANATRVSGEHEKGGFDPTVAGNGETAVLQARDAGRSGISRERFVDGDLDANED